MSTDKHIDKWRMVEKSALKSCGVDIECYALVAIGKDGECFWGGDFGKSPYNRKALEVRLKTLLNDLRRAIQ